MNRKNGKHDKRGGIELIHPLTGEVVATDDLDGLIRALADVKAQMRELYGFQHTLSRLIADAAPPIEDTLFQRTARIATEENRVRLTYAAPKFEQSVLREVWGAWPKIAPQYIAIGGLRVRLAEYKKLVKTEGGTTAFRRFKIDLMAARIVGLDSPPKVEIEEAATNGFAPDDLDYHRDEDDDEA